MQFVYEQAQSKMFGRFKFIQIMTPMYKQRNSNENDVKLILNQAIIQIFPKITYKGFRRICMYALRQTFVLLL